MPCLLSLKLLKESFRILISAPKSFLLTFLKIIMATNAGKNLPTLTTTADVEKGDKNDHGSARSNIKLLGRFKKMPVFRPCPKS